MQHLFSYGNASVSSVSTEALHGFKAPKVATKLVISSFNAQEILIVGFPRPFASLSNGEMHEKIAYVYCCTNRATPHKFPHLRDHCTYQGYHHQRCSPKGLYGKEVCHKEPNRQCGLTAQIKPSKWLGLALWH